MRIVAHEWRRGEDLKVGPLVVIHHPPYGPKVRPNKNSEVTRSARERTCSGNGISTRGPGGLTRGEAGPRETLVSCRDSRRKAEDNCEVRLEFSLWQWYLNRCPLAAVLKCAPYTLRAIKI